MKKSLPLLLSLALFCTTLTGCTTNAGTSSGSAPASDAPTLYLGAFLPGTDGESDTVLAGATYARSLRPTVTVGGVSYWVELYRPGQEDPSELAQAIVDKSCVAAFGHMGERSYASSATIFRTAQLPALCLSSVDTDLSRANDFLFRCGLSAQEEGALLAQWAVDQDLLEAVTLHCVEQEASIETAAGFTHGLEQAGGKVVASLPYQPDQTDFSALLKAIQKSGAKVVCAPTSLKQGISLLNQAAEQKIKVQWLSGGTWESDGLTRNTGDNCQGVVLAASYGVGKDPAFDQWAEEHLPAGAPRSSAALGYDCYNLLLDAIQAADSLEGDAICQALQTLNQKEALCGPVSFDAYGQPVSARGCLVRVKDGAFQLAKHP